MNISFNIDQLNDQSTERQEIIKPKLVRSPITLERSPITLERSPAQFKDSPIKVKEIVFPNNKVSRNNEATRQRVREVKTLTPLKNQTVQIKSNYNTIGKI